MDCREDGCGADGAAACCGQETVPPADAASCRGKGTAAASTRRDQDCCDQDLAAEEKAEATEGGLTFQVEGLDCADEVAILQEAVGPLVGGRDRLAFDVLHGRMTLRDAAPTVSIEQVLDAVAGTGMSARLWEAGSAERSVAQEAHRRNQARATALSGLALLSGFALHVWDAGGLRAAVGQLWGQDDRLAPLPEVAAYSAAVLFGARYVLPKAWHAARRLRPDMHLLMTIAVGGAAVIGQWFEAATVAFLFAVSLALESWSVGRARRAISALLDLAPSTARLQLDDGSERETPAAEVPVGARFVVLPGERIPLDGRVAAGSSGVDQAPITGESMPVAKAAGDEVFAGTVNGEGALEVVSTRPAGDTTLARITRLVEGAHQKRARAEQWVERFARVYTPAVILLAVGIFLVPPLALGGAWEEWFYRALVLLVVSCPCALVISTPVTIVAALASAARRGVLVKGGVFLELPARLRAVAFDKTGTLTLGEAEVVGVTPLNGHTDVEVLERAAALESRNTHPLARAIVAHAERQGLTPAPATDVRAVPGKGVCGSFAGEALWLGSQRFLAERGVDAAPALAAAAAFETRGQTVVVIGNDEHVCGLLAVADAVRPGAATALTHLRRAGIDHLVMLTGDNAPTAQTIADQVGIDEVHAGLLPEDKLAAVEDLVARHGDVAMVGDGVNDAPAMARAGLSVAMGAAGSDVAIETADIALMADDLERLPWLVAHSQRALRVIRQNVALSLGVKAAFVILTLAGMATLWGAIAADMGVSLLVVGNGLRLLRDRTGTRGGA